MPIPLAFACLGGAISLLPSALSLPTSTPASTLMPPIGVNATSCPTAMACESKDFAKCYTACVGPISELTYTFALSKCTPTSEWTIHGLWPNYAIGGYPCLCAEPDMNGDVDTYRPEALAPLYDRLLKFWPTCMSEGCGQDYFWRHEWEKHGTCMLAAGIVRDQAHYFNTSVALLENLLADGTIEGACKGKEKECFMGVPIDQIREAEAATGYVAVGASSPATNIND